MFPIPSLQYCVAQARAAFLAAQPGLNAWLWPNNIGPTAKVLGGEVWQLFNRLAFIGQQIFAGTATGLYLDAQGQEINVIRLVATAAVGNVIVTTTGAAAAASGAMVQRGDGALFTATAPASIAGAGGMTVPVQATLVGSTGLTEDGSPMTLVSGFTGAGIVGATAAVDSNGITGGADVEADGPPWTSDLSYYRGRVLFRKRNPTQGGAPSDYVQWCTAVQGCTRVFVERIWVGPGSVRVFPLFDGLFAGGIPDSAHLAAVQAAIAPLAPAATLLSVAAAAPQNVPIVVTNLNPQTPAAQASVIAEVTDAFTQYGRVSGNNLPVASMPYLAVPFTFLAIWAESAVANAAGVIGADVAVSDTVIAEGCVPIPVVTFA